MTINKLMKFLYVLTILFFIACRKDSQNPPNQPSAVDTISLETFLSVPPPTFKQLQKALEDIISKDSSLKRNKSGFTKALYLWVKAHPNGSLVGGRVVLDEKKELPTDDRILGITISEWKLIFGADFYELTALVNAYFWAELAVYDEFPCDYNPDEFDNSKANAILHSYWNAMMARYGGKEFAEKYATAHESLFPDAPNSKMDLHNNKYGRDFQEKYHDASDQELLQILLRQKFVFIKPDEVIPPDLDALVFINVKRQYDVTLSGSLTNPDSGGPWNATFDFTQCGVTIRGQYTVTRQAALQKRRFTGTLAQDGTITLDVSDPYAFENAPLGSFCTNSKMILKGSEKKMTGTWTSSNCLKGGTVNLQ